MSFALLGLAPALLRAVDERGYQEPTPIQAAAIPAILGGRDMLGRARTGSGKTAAFALPLLQQQASAHPVARPTTERRGTARRLHTLVLVPTRELALQVGESFRLLARHLAPPLKVVTAFGGVSINPQMMGLRGGADIVVATPGRLLDLIEHNALRLDGVAALVLDEADRLLDLGFADELQRLLALLPARRQSLFFSASFPPAVKALAEAMLNDPVQLDADAPPVPHLAIRQRVIEVDAVRRTQLLRHLAQQHAGQRMLVFVATRYGCELVADKLGRAGIAATALHGDLSQGARTQALAAFKADALQVLVATDVAARGIDIAELPIVLNYDLPRSAVDYLHRIGRTGRAGQDGLAISFVSAESEAHWRLIEKRHGLRLERERIEGFEPAEDAATAAAPTGGIKGRRKSKKDKLREAAAALQPKRTA
ncbi:DEAD/DEAH box helicase [Rivibacter subsaxonicus]|uniref:Superfamily II DNA/RNA helicase n=1 Tax=Rivibacter subsaxonicus TaxID=457575 RepID=A0A4Q7W1Y0_9BURK|nr:DEAD/DEAH box helicase [Rivibacter subsaxonicus]RZU02865.1 superfamily II DNA/RNA helicase [Rivibacter subsaxonicus]